MPFEVSWLVQTYHHWSVVPCSCIQKYLNSASLQLDTGNMWMGYDIVPKFVLNCGLIEKHTTMKTDPRDGRCRKTMKNNLINLKCYPYLSIVPQPFPLAPHRPCQFCTHPRGPRIALGRSDLTAVQVLGRNTTGMAKPGIREVRSWLEPWKPLKSHKTKTLENKTYRSSC